MILGAGLLAPFKHAGLGALLGFLVQFTLMFTPVFVSVRS
jgi:hypothetical protein